MAKSDSGTLVIDNFAGSLTNFSYGPINSGRSYSQVCSGQNPFTKPGRLTWNNAPVQIDSSGSVITDLILAGKERVESGVLYVYAIGHTGRVYKIQVNDPNTSNPDYDNPVLLTTLTINSPTFTNGGFIDFFGATEQIIIGHDQGATKLNFDGTMEAFIGILGSWTQNVPRPLKQFVGKEYIGNGENLAELDATNTITTYTKLTPGFPSGTQVRDIDVSPDGNYLETVVSRLALYDVTSATPETTSTANSESFIFKWNGSDTGYTSFTSFPSFALSANMMFQNYQYTFGTDQFGTAVYNPTEKILSVPEGPSPLPNAVLSTGNMMMYIMPIYFGGVLEADIICWGSNDFEVGHPLGYWDVAFFNATSPETDVVRTPMMMSVSNTGLGSSTNGYAGNLFSTSKIYFSSLETSATTTKYRFYKLNFVTTTVVSVDNPMIDAVYQTQIQAFSRKVSVGAVRVYAEPWIAGNSFRVDLIGSDGLAITGSSKTFTASTGNANGIATDGQCVIGDDFAWYGPDSAPTYAIGLSITNLGTTNFTVNKVEIDYSPAGQ